MSRVRVQTRETNEMVGKESPLQRWRTGRGDKRVVPDQLLVKTKHSRVHEGPAILSPNRCYADQARVGAQH